MGNKYKKQLEREWNGKSLSDIKLKTLQIQADRNLTKVTSGSYGRIRRRLK